MLLYPPRANQLFSLRSNHKDTVIGLGSELTPLYLESEIGDEMLPRQLYDDPPAGLLLDAQELCVDLGLAEQMLVLLLPFDRVQIVVTVELSLVQ